MQTANAFTRPPIASRPASCLWCHAATTQADVVRNHGLCRGCVHDNVELSWRVVYDRDRNIGRIPSNLRAAYRL